jgi:cytidylate kinase
MKSLQSVVRQITITGACGAGKGSAGKITAQVLGFSFVSLGDIFRNVALERGCRDITELHDRAKTDPSIDLAIDRHTQLYGEEKNRFVYDARLGWHWMPQSFKVFLDCSDEERFRRISEREHKMVEIVRRETLSREEKMRKQYLHLYHIDDFMRRDETRFDIIIDTTKITPDEVAQEIVRAFNRRIT